MKLVVLLSVGRHPVSGKPALPRTEAQAIRIAAELGASIGLHVGPDAFPAEAALGHGLDRAIHLACAGGPDPIGPLVSRLAAEAADVVLAGRRGQGGEETGLAPYAVAARLGVPIVPDAVAIRPAGDGLVEVDQALPKGALRRLVVRTPLVVTVHPNAPAPLPYAFGKARRGSIERVDAAAADLAAVAPAPEERPYRKRPKMMRAAGGSAADRLKAVTGEATAGGAKILDGPTPEDAAKEVLAFLRRVGVLAPAGAGATGPTA